MNKQIFRKLSLIIIPLLVIGVAIYFGVSFKVEKIEAGVSLSNVFDLFNPYETWPNSTTKKAGTAAEWLHAMQTGTASAPWETFADINGDGLADILVHTEGRPGPISSETYYYYGVLLNRGDLTFDLVYKCVWVAGRFYGDCAAL